MRFVAKLIFLDSITIPTFVVAVFLPKIACPKLYELGGFFAVAASRLHLLMLFVHYSGPGTNLLCILLLNYFF